MIKGATTFVGHRLKMREGGAVWARATNWAKPCLMLPQTGVTQHWWLSISDRKEDDQNQDSYLPPTPPLPAIEDFRKCLRALVPFIGSECPFDPVWKSYNSGGVSTQAAFKPGERFFGNRIYQNISDISKCTLVEKRRQKSSIEAVERFFGREGMRQPRISKHSTIWWTLHCSLPAPDLNDQPIDRQKFPLIWLFGVLNLEIYICHQYRIFSWRDN